ncbi:MAG: DUF952 domain-containing protein [bacterium]|nr:DUF952 domain-containing protein [bacterium]
MFIYHIVLPEIWERAKHNSTYAAESLESEGFIHCSYEDQLDGVIGRYYSDAPDLVILKLDVNKLTSKLVSEPSTGGEVYPHIYGPINLDAVVEVRTRSDSDRVP